MNATTVPCITEKEKLHNHSFIFGTARLGRVAHFLYSEKCFLEHRIALSELSPSLLWKFSWQILGETDSKLVSHPYICS